MSSITTGSNIASLRTIRLLDKTTRGLGQTLERLSSGMRINRASDDAAGLSIAADLNVRSRILNRGLLNINDASSLLNIAEGATGEISNLLTRMQELAEQAANGTLSSAQRRNLDREYQQLDREIRRISATTSFNGINVLEGQKSARAAKLLQTGSLITITSTSADGRFVSIQDTGTHWIVDTETGERVNISSVTGGNSARVMNDGDLIFHGTVAGAYNLYYFDYQTQTTRQLTTDGGVINDYQSFDVSADGSTIFTHKGTNGIVIDVATGASRNIGGTFTSGHTFKLSADGRYLATLGGGVLRTTDLNSSNPTVVTTALTGTNSLRGITNDGMAFITSNANYTSQNGAGVVQLFAFDLNSQQFDQRTRFTTNILPSNLVMSTDGTSFYGATTNDLVGENPTGRMQAYRLDGASGNVTQLTNYTTNVLQSIGTFSADGSKYIHTVAFGQLYSTDITPEATNLNFEVGMGSSGTIDASLNGLRNAIRGLGAYVLTSASAARSALTRIGDNIEALAKISGIIGASQSRLSVAHSLASSQANALTDAESQIQSADIAEESATLTRQRILQNVSASLLAQSNRQPELVLQLLRGR